MNAYLAVAIVNTAICGVVLAGIWITKSAWPLLGFLFFMSAQHKKSDDSKNDEK